jgi:hypothetical protein
MLALKKAKDGIGASLTLCAVRLIQYFNVRANVKSNYIFKGRKRQQPASTIEFFRW